MNVDTEGQWCNYCDDMADHRSKECPDRPEGIAAMIERSSFGTPAAKAARESVSDEVVARVVQRAREIRTEKRLAACPNPHGTDGIIECWSPGGSCRVPNDPGCEMCGGCFICTDRPAPTDRTTP